MTDIALDEKACAQTSLADHIARFWHMIEDEPHVRILVNVRRDTSSVPYWDSSSFPNDVAKAIAAERRYSPSQVAPQPQAGEPVEAHGYATRLLTSLMEKHYPDRSPEWTPLPDLYGVLTQIDNLSTGLVRASPQPANPAQVTDALDTDKIATWPALKKALWDVVTFEQLNDGHYINAYDLTDKLHFAVTAAIGAGGQAVVVVVKPLEWIERWYGSEPMKGWSIVQDREPIAYLGPDVDGEQVTAIVMAHNAALTLSQPHPADERVVEALRTKVEEIRARVEKTICPTFSSDSGDIGEQGRISREDFDTLVISALGRAS